MPSALLKFRYNQASVATITISGGNTVVNIRGIVIDGLNGSDNPTGILSTYGVQLNVENCVIQGFQTGISLGTLNGNTQVHIQDTIIKNGTGHAITVNPNGAFSANVTLSRVQVTNNAGDGLRVDARNDTRNVTVAVSDSVFNENGAAASTTSAAAAPIR